VTSMMPTGAMGPSPDDTLVCVSNSVVIVVQHPA
jgi:hypothetical protein